MFNHLCVQTTLKICVFCGGIFSSADLAEDRKAKKNCVDIVERFGEKTIKVGRVFAIDFEKHLECDCILE